MELLGFFLLCFTTLFAIVDPLGVAPVFLAMTAGNSRNEQVRMARIGSATAGAVLLFFTFGGQALFRLLGISQAAFSIAGGIILLLAALDMLRARQVAVRTSIEERDAAAAKTDIAITPLAIPLLAGPGAISAALVLSGRADSPGQMTALALAILLLAVITYLCLRWSLALDRLLGPIGVRVLERLIGLILAALAIQFIMNGVVEFLK